MSPSILTEDPVAMPGPAPAAEPARHRFRTAVARILPWALVAAVLVGALLLTGTAGNAVARYAAYWLLCLLLPGTLCHRALRGSRGNLPEDLGYGAVTGLLFELVAWVTAAATGLQGLLWAWPAPVVLLFLVVPRLRRHWRTGPGRPL
ncbi:MAG: hypothetical protein WCA46_19740, partial [Actinocatenispora sp.]